MCALPTAGSKHGAPPSRRCGAIVSGWGALVLYHGRGPYVDVWEAWPGSGKSLLHVGAPLLRRTRRAWWMQRIMGAGRAQPSLVGKGAGIYEIGQGRPPAAGGWSGALVPHYRHGRRGGKFGEWESGIRGADAHSRQQMWHGVGSGIKAVCAGHGTNVHLSSACSLKRRYGIKWAYDPGRVLLGRLNAKENTKNVTHLIFKAFKYPRIPSSMHQPAVVVEAEYLPDVAHASVAICRNASTVHQRPKSRVKVKLKS
ncbi:hypothetical protein B0H14DRAFT_2619825 [Mycena olivaceomarginata]|nr:hypothetical protein B0H14DRAFT_2619825 [Mycena olivaceomarginata]